MLYVIFVILLTIVLASSLRVAAENERVAIFRFGRYRRLKGPGLAITLPIANHCFKISFGDQGELMTYGWARFKNRELPVQHNERIQAGSRIKVSGFAEGMVHIVFAPDRQ